MNFREKLHGDVSMTGTLWDDYPFILEMVKVRGGKSGKSQKYTLAFTETDCKETR